jgi:two-component system NtrC family sensor kinase
LASGVAHEVNNPLAIINEKAGLMRDLVSSEETPPSQERLLKLIDAVLGSVSRCTKITHRLLGFARHMNVQFETIDLPELIGEVLGFLEKEFKYRNIAVGVRNRSEMGQIRSDRGQLQQVFLNLINNAVSAVADGGHIDIEIVQSNENALTVEISDDGQGIPRENQERIFEPFFTTKQGGGTGLGLSITYGIVKKLGGDISVKSELGNGTCFTVVLPIQKSKTKNQYAGLRTNAKTIPRGESVQS